MDYSIFQNEIVVDIVSKFKRKCPRTKGYVNRLATEFTIILKKNFYNFFQTSIIIF